MTDRAKLADDDVKIWLSSHPSWTLTADGKAVERAWKFPDFASALAFVVKAGMMAEKRDHHPDVELGWGRALLRFTTHDRGGLTRFDLDAAHAADALS